MPYFEFRLPGLRIPFNIRFTDGLPILSKVNTYPNVSDSPKHC
jgi:hypothetical protein